MKKKKNKLKIIDHFTAFDGIVNKRKTLKLRGLFPEVDKAVDTGINKVIVKRPNNIIMLYENAS